MSHTSRTVMAAMLHAHREARATARPERATDEVIGGLAGRLTRAIETTQVLADAPRASDESHTLMSIRMVRLEGKVQGLKVALSYVQEIRRAERAEMPDPRDVQWQRALDMYGAGSEHGSDCGLEGSGCNACILDDAHRIIFGVTRPSTETTP